MIASSWMPVSSIKVLSTGEPFHLSPRESRLILSRNISTVRKAFRGELMPQDSTGTTNQQGCFWSASVPSVLRQGQNAWAEASCSPTTAYTLREADTLLGSHLSTVIGAVDVKSIRPSRPTPEPKVSPENSSTAEQAPACCPWRSAAR